MDAEQASSQEIIDSMRTHGIMPTAEHFAIWESYLNGTKPALKKAVEIFLTNGRALDAQTLRRLHAKHFGQSQEALTLRHSVRRLLRLWEEGIDDSSGKSARQNFDAELRAILAQSDALCDELMRTESQVTQLEKFLDDARREATTDSLTGLANRRAFDTALRAATGDAMNNGAELAIVLIDVDHFKRVNDHHGHAVGDDVLQQVAATLKRSVRGKDIPARYGGEEFAIILPATPGRGALAVAENVRQAVQAHDFTSARLAGGATIQATISAGVANYDHGENLDTWVARADAALYVAKQSGRNRVAYGPPTLVS